MKPPKVHSLRLLSIFFFTSAFLLVVSGSQPSAEDDVTQAGWQVEIEEGKSTRATLTINNRCSAPHLFRVKSSAKFLRFEQPTDAVQIQAKSNKQVAAQFEATGLKVKVYRSKVTVECLDCKKEPGCNQDRDELPVEMIVTKTKKIVVPRPSGSIMGRVVDPRNTPIRGAEVHTPGQPVVLTNGKGEFDIRGLAATERLAVSFSAPGFMDTTRIYQVGELSRITGNVVVIWPRAAPVSLDATQGGKLTFPGGTVSFPPRALVDGAGRPLQGQVKVSFSSLDVSDRRQIRSAPGDFTARMRNKGIRQLETFGVFEVFVEDSEGRRADLAKGRKAAVELFLPRALRGRAPRQVGLYAFDKDSGLWAEEGTLELNSVRPSFMGSIDNITTTGWNADVTIDTVCMRVKILNEDGTPAPIGTRVEAEGVDYTGTSPTGFVTDATGEVCLLVKKCVATVRVVAYDQNNSAVNSCPVRIGTPCQSTAASDCSDPSQCPLQPEEIILPGGTLYHDLNADNPAYWHAANNWSNWNSTNNNFYDVWWYASHVVFNNDGIMRLLLDAAPPPANPTPVIYSSGEYRTNATYGYGTYEVCMKAAKGPGLMTSFFTYTDTPQHHEIDVEFRGQNTWEMWTNFFYDNTDHAQAIQLGFDAAEDFHRYKFVWTQNDIKWYVDGVEKHPEYSTNYPGWPTLPGKIMVNLWSGNSISDNWLGDFCAAQIPVTAEYDWIRYKP